MAGVPFPRDAPVVGIARQPSYLEGFWASSPDPAADGYHGAYPWPIAHAAPWEGHADFQSALAGVEAAIVDGTLNAQTGASVVAGIPLSSAHVYSYGAPSACRLCSADVGNREFTLSFALPLAEGGAMCVSWPSGLAHYVDAHNVAPSRLFFDVIMDLNRHVGTANVGGGIFKGLLRRLSLK